MVRTELTIADCRRAVQVYHRILKRDMLGSTRIDRVAQPRQMAMTLARELTGKSLPRIGEEFGDRDHSTVLHGIQTVEKRRTASVGYGMEYEGLRLTLAVYAAQKARWP